MIANDSLPSSSGSGPDFGIAGFNGDKGFKQAEIKIEKVYSLYTTTNSMVCEHTVLPGRKCPLR